MSVQRVLERAEALHALWGARSSSIPTGAATGPELLRVLDIVGQLARDLDAVAVEAAGELESRGLAMSLGFRTATDAVAEHAGVPVDEARTWTVVGAATVPTVSLAGEVLPPERPAIAAGLRDGTLGVADASLVLRTIEQIAPFADTSKRAAVEEALVAQAPGATRRDLAILARRVIDHLDPDGAEPREDLLRARSGVRVHRTPDGLVRWSITMHPEAAGYLTTAVDARTAPRRQPRFSVGGPGIAGVADPDHPSDSNDPDVRPLAQRRLDALVDIARESLQRETGHVAGTPVTMLVTIPLEQLRSGIGAAEIAGVDEPVSAATARRLASDAEIIPVVLGGPSEPLDQGRACRLFTPAQRRAMAVRDGGCVWPGCNAPPGWCEAAHLRSWLDGGPTDLANGVLLCAFHHRRLDHDGWRFVWRTGVLWLIPPPQVDSTRAPRRAGRLPEVA